ncbi:MAG: MATE family efflux transporter [Pyramidobacter sp.]|nr:MATE family efflux transporter [Pyramidobacter sp.]
MSRREHAARSEAERQFAQAPVGSLVAQYAVPAVVSLLVNSLYNIVDQVFIGQGVGFLGNAATNVSFPLVSVTMALGLLLGVGCSANFSLRLGERRKELAAQCVGNSLTLQIITGAVLLIGCMTFLEPLLRAFGATDTVLPYALEYTRITLLGTPMVLVGLGLSNVIRADGSARYVMWISVAGALLNTVLDPIFIFPWGLNMGVAGAAWATVISQALVFALTIAYLPRFQCIHFTLSCMALKLSVVRRVLTLGASSLLNHLTLVLVQITVNNSVVHYGALSVYGADIPLAVMGIVMKVNQILMSLVIGISIGAQPIMGFNYGAQNFRRVVQTYKTALAAATCCAAGAFFMFQTFPAHIVSLFGKENPLYMEYAVKTFRVFLFMCFTAGVQVITTGYFQGTGRPLRAIVLTLTQRMLFFIPLMLLLPLRFGLDGVLLTGPVSDSAALTVTLFSVVPDLKRLIRLETD